MVARILFYKTHIISTEICYRARNDCFSRAGARPAKRDCAMFCKKESSLKGKESPEVEPFSRSKVQPRGFSSYLKASEAFTALELQAPSLAHQQLIIQNCFLKTLFDWRECKIGK